MSVCKAFSVGVLITMMAGCNGKEENADMAKYFDSPASAVEQISVMLREKNWPELANYYDLDDSPIERSELVSGEFFYTDEEPAVAHPAGFWHYKHPFAPPFKFDSVRTLEDPAIVEVTVAVEIDQGGGMIQRGMQTFLMRKSEKGYQVLPHKAPVL